MFGNLKKIFGMKKPESVPVIQSKPVEPLPFNLSLEKMQEDALNTISNILKHRATELEVLISASRLRVMLHKTSDFQTKHLARIFPALFDDSEMNCMNLHGNPGDSFRSESHGFTWALNKEYIKIDFYFTPDSLSEEEATEILSNLLAGVENNAPVESNTDAECVGLADTLENIEARTYRPFLPRTSMTVAEAVKRVTGFVFSGKEVRARKGISNAADEVLSFAGCPVEQAKIDQKTRVTFSNGHQKGNNPTAAGGDASQWGEPRAATTPVAHM